MNSRRKTYLVFGLALVVQVISMVMWYVYSPHLTQFSRYLPQISNLISGALIGMLDSRYYLRKTLVLGVLITVINSIIHWSEGYLGVPVDFGAASDTIFLTIIVMPICIALSMLGGMMGALASRVFFQNQRMD
jgi:hypothetical protein